MALANHSLDGSLVVVDVAPVVAVHEESGLVAVLLELVEKLVGVVEGAIVEGEGNVLVDSALRDSDTDGDSSGGGLDKASVGGELNKRETHDEDVRFFKYKKGSE